MSVVGPTSSTSALIQHVLTVMYCACWAHNRLRLKHEARTSVGLICGQCHRRCADIRTTSCRDITNLWSLYPALMSHPSLFVYSHIEGVNVLCNFSVPGKNDTLNQCWASIADGGPALSQYWFNVPCGRGP